MAKKLLTEWVSPTEYAKHRGITLAQVKDLIDEGKLENCWKFYNNNRKKINWRAADLALAKAKEEADKPVDSEQGEGSNQQLGVNNLTKARTVKTTMEAKAAQLKYEQLAGSLVKREDVVRVAKEMARFTKESLLSLADRLAPTLAGKKDIDEIHIILTQEIHTALRNLKAESYDFFREEEEDES